MNKIYSLLLLCFVFSVNTHVVAQHPDIKTDSIGRYDKYHTWKPDFSNAQDRRLLTAGVITQAWAILVTGASGNGTPHKVKMATEGFALGLVGWTAVAVSTNIATASIVYLALFGIPTAIIAIAGAGILVHAIIDPPHRERHHTSITNSKSEDLVGLNDTGQMVLKQLVLANPLPSPVNIDSLSH